MRPQKERSIGFVPKCRRFSPMLETGEDSEPREEETITIGLDMLEAMRLVDVEGLNQESAAQSMSISAPTLCRILNQGRKRAALALTQGISITIEGGRHMYGQGHQGRNRRGCGQGQRAHAGTNCQCKGTGRNAETGHMGRGCGRRQNENSEKNCQCKGAGPHTETSPTSANAEIVREEQN